MSANSPTVTSPAPTFKEATRVLTSVLAPVEKRTLLWLAARMPRAINSDHLTVLALLAMVAAGPIVFASCGIPIDGDDT